MKNLVLLLLGFLVLSGCKKEDMVDPCSLGANGTVTDIDGNVYQTVTLGTQEWMTENLRTTRYACGDTIPQIIEASAWNGLGSGAWSWFNNESSMEGAYGKLYNWYAVNDTCGICPTGWHVPTDEDWKTLEIYLGMDSLAADSIGFAFRGINKNIGGKMQSVGDGLWIEQPDATNESCFSGLPGGARYRDGVFSNTGYYGSWWSSTSRNSTTSWFRGLSHNNGSVSRSYYHIRYGASVRCVRD